MTTYQYLPMQPLLDWIGGRPLSDFGWDHRGWQSATFRHRRRIGTITVEQADRLACSLGLHPVEIWHEEWWDAVRHLQIRCERCGAIRKANDGLGAHRRPDGTTCGNVWRAADRPARGWRDEAACQGADPRLFNALDLQTPEGRAAADICATCPVRADCYAWANSEPWYEGIAGGTVWISRPYGNAGAA